MCTLKLILKGEGDLSWGFEEKYIYIYIYSYDVGILIEESAKMDGFLDIG